MRLRKRLRYLYYRAVRSHGEPRQIALGMAIGVVVSLAPILGHFPVAVGLAALTGQSKLAAGVGVWANNPVTMPFLFGAAYAVGARVLGYTGPPPGGILGVMASLTTLTSGVFLTLWVGWAVLAVPAGALTYWLTYQGIVAYRLKARARREGLPHRWHWSEERGWHRLPRSADRLSTPEDRRDARRP